MIFYLLQGRKHYNQRAHILLQQLRVLQQTDKALLQLAIQDPSEDLHRPSGKVSHPNGGPASPATIPLPVTMQSHSPTLNIEPSNRGPQIVRNSPFPSAEGLSVDIAN